MEKLVADAMRGILPSGFELDDIDSLDDEAALGLAKDCERVIVYLRSLQEVARARAGTVRHPPPGDRGLEV